MAREDDDLDGEVDDDANDDDDEEDDLVDEQYDDVNYLLLRCTLRCPLLMLDVECIHIVRMQGFARCMLRVDDGSRLYADAIQRRF